MREGPEPSSRAGFQPADQANASMALCPAQGLPCVRSASAPLGRWWVGLALRAVGLLLVACAVAVGQAEEPPVKVEVRVEPGEVTVGDVFMLTVQVTAQKHVNLKLPGEGADFGPAEVRSFDKEESRGPSGETVVRLRYDLALFEVGEREIKAPPISYQEEGAKTRQAARPTAGVTVKSVLPKGAQDIKDIRGPRAMPLSAWYWVGLTAAALLLLGLVAAGIILWRRLSGQEDEEERAPPLPAHVEALGALDELEAEDLVAQGKLKEHYVTLSWIIRRYLSRRYRVAALEETTVMLAASLRSSGRAPAQARDFLPVLAEADLVKFARYRPEDVQAKRAVDDARRVVNATRPREVPGGVLTDAAAAT